MVIVLVEIAFDRTVPIPSPKELIQKVAAVPIVVVDAQRPGMVSLSLPLPPPSLLLNLSPLVLLLDPVRALVVVPEVPSPLFRTAGVGIRATAGPRSVDVIDGRVVATAAVADASRPPETSP